MNSIISNLIRIILALILSLSVSICTVGFVKAADSSSSSSAGTSSSSSGNQIIDKLKKIEILKEKIATKVAEIRAKEKRGAVGTIKTINPNSILVKTSKDEITMVYADDTTVFELKDTGKADFSIKKLKEGDLVAVLGYLNDPQSSIITAKYIYREQIKTRSTGKIADIDKANFTITLAEPKGNTIIDIETYTKISSYSREKGLVKTGFSKLKVGDLVHVVGTANAKEENRISALRIISITSGLSASPSPKEETNATSSPTAAKNK